MTENQKQIKVPYRILGDWSKYKGYKDHNTWGSYYKEYVYEDNIPFKAKLKYLDYERGQSALNIIWLDEKNKKIYRSGMPLLSSAIQNKKLKGEYLESDFCFKKQGRVILLVEHE